MSASYNIKSEIHVGNALKIGVAAGLALRTVSGAWKKIFKSKKVKIPKDGGNSKPPIEFPAPQRWFDDIAG